MMPTVATFAVTSRKSPPAGAITASIWVAAGSSIGSAPAVTRRANNAGDGNSFAPVSDVKPSRYAPGGRLITKAPFVSGMRRLMSPTVGSFQRCSSAGNITADTPFGTPAPSSVAVPRSSRTWGAACKPNKKTSARMAVRIFSCYLLLVTCYLLLVTCYLLLVTCYLLLVTCYLSFESPPHPHPRRSSRRERDQRRPPDFNSFVERIVHRERPGERAPSREHANIELMRLGELEDVPVVVELGGQ